MNDRETARYDMFGRVQTFGADHAADFAPGSEVTMRFANIAQIIKDLDTAKAAQINEGVTAKEVLIDALRIDARNISTARAIAQDEAGFADKFPVPKSPSQRDLLTTADAYIVELQKPGVAVKFTAKELPADFLQDLIDDRAAIDAAKDDIESEDNENVASTAAIGRVIKAGMKEVNYVNASMHNKYSRDADKLRPRKSASHIERALQREKKLAPNPAEKVRPKP